MGFGTRVWDLEGAGAATSSCTPAIYSNKDAVPAGTRSSDTKVGTNVAAGGTWQKAFSWTTESIGIADWPQGDYEFSFDVARIPSGTWAHRAVVASVQSGCTQIASFASESLATSGGVYAGTFTFNPNPGSATDRLQIQLEYFYPFGAAARFEVTVNSANTYLRAPLFAGQRNLLGQTRRKQRALLIR